jgi:hypothetical protein
MSTVEEVVDATVVESPPEPPPVERRAELALRPPATTQVLMPMDVDQVVQGMAAYQSLLPKLLDESDYQGRVGSRDRFVKKSGWRKIARAFNLSLERISESVERDDDGLVVRASAVYRAVAPNGQYGDGDGYCSADEPRFKDAKGRQKLENDLRATATTRAKNRAISDLVGMGEVSAEEIGAAPVEAGPAYGPVVADAQKAATVTALIKLIALDADPLEPAPADLKAAASTVAKVIAQAAGYMPQIVADALMLAADARAARAAGPDLHLQGDVLDDKGAHLPGTVPLSDKRAGELCICPQGLQTDPERRADSCPLVSHGIGF